MPRLQQQLVATVENTIKLQAPQEAKNRARTRIVGVLAKARPPASNLKPEETKALKQIKSDMSLAIVPADKGNCTVVLDRVQYDSKILSMLNDKDTYEKLPKDLTSTLERCMNAVLLRLRRSGHLSEAQYNRLRSSAGRIPLIYGLPKIHKADVSLRPIVSFVSSPTYQLSKHLRMLPPKATTRSHRVHHPQLQAVLYFYCHPGSSSWRILSIR